MSVLRPAHPAHFTPHHHEGLETMPKQSSSAQLKSTRQWVHDYATLLLEHGEEVRQSAIRELIAAEHGITASPNLVTDEIKKFWAKAGPTLSARLRRPGIPDDVCESFDNIWGVALNAAVAGHDTERLQLQQQADSALASAVTARANEQAAIDKFFGQTREIEGLRMDKAFLAEQLQANDVERKNLTTRIKEISDQATAQQAVHTQEQQRLQGLIDRLLQQLTDLRSSSQQELTALAESHQNELVKTQDFLMREAVRVRDEHKAKTEKLSKELEKESIEKEHFRLLRSKASDEAAELRGRLEATTRNLEKLEQNYAQLHEKNEKLQASLLEHFKVQLISTEKKDFGPI
ncbi:DNA-binding protein [Pseudomonas prosekii]|uniref:DNA-binding protein n=1 Tax=Pseudomonas prosekii TaxID=1148509 RepID=UPI003F74D9E6